MRRIPLLFLLTLLAAFPAACTPPTTIPIGTIDFHNSPGSRHDTLLVFLPGLRDKPGVYAEEGFIEAAERSGLKADMIAVDAHLGYYKEKKLLGRLKEDVIEPAKRRGYRRIWLVGISLGGFGAIWYDVENPGDLAGIVALSPYLGEPEMVDEVARAGGLRKWRPPAERELDDQHRIWRGLKSYEKREKSTGRVFLGYGCGDKFATPDGMLAAVLPGDQVFTMDGGHAWPVWRALWDEVLKHRVFEQDGGN
jgi:pimeloyl-ACP methyl ester carboxylesterase